ncbi:hypothetical protein MHU86_12497 [Fragilaria crotonensis]|nr:hypothetical protein MHU86_12497 [Fragilaria crotonensis]
MNSESAATSASLQPTRNDVLLGRAATVFHHPGNCRYREIIAINLRRYKEAKTRLDKMVLIRQITEQILDDGRVRFLRHDNRSDTWTEVPFRLIQDKVSHALRDGLNKSIFSPLMPEEESTTLTSEEDSKLSATSVSGSLTSKLPNHGEISNTGVPRHDAGTGNASDAARNRMAASETARINPSSQRFDMDPAVRLGSMTLATATTRAALSKLNMLSGRPQPPPMLGTSLARTLPQQHAFVGSSQPHPRLLPPLITAPVPRGFGGTLTPILGLPTTTSLTTRPLTATAGYPYYNTGLPFLPEPQKIMRTNPLMEALALKEQNQQVLDQLAATAVRRQMLQTLQHETLQKHEQTNTKRFVNQVVQQYNQSLPVAGKDKGKPSGKKAKRQK